jgi:hypothetical protein
LAYLAENNLLSLTVIDEPEDNGITISRDMMPMTLLANSNQPEPVALLSLLNNNSVSK